MPMASLTVCIILLMLVFGYAHQPVETLEDNSVLQGDRWAPLVPNSRPLTTKEIADQRFHPVPAIESQLSPAIIRMIQAHAASSSTMDKRYTLPTTALSNNRKIRAEGENVANMLGMLKKMEECMKLTEGLRFRKRGGDLEDGQQQQAEVWRTVNKRADSSHRIRALKNMCQL